MLLVRLVNELLFCSPFHPQTTILKTFILNWECKYMTKCYTGKRYLIFFENVCPTPLTSLLLRPVILTKEKL